MLLYLFSKWSTWLPPICCQTRAVICLWQRVIQRMNFQFQVWTRMFSDLGPGLFEKQKSQTKHQTWNSTIELTLLCFFLLTMEFSVKTPKCMELTTFDLKFQTRLNKKCSKSFYRLLYGLYYQTWLLKASRIWNWNIMYWFFN